MILVFNSHVFSGFIYEAILIPVSGPEDTPFEGGLFSATLSFPKDYPLSPPKMKFTCPMFHPNGKRALLSG